MWSAIVKWLGEQYPNLIIFIILACVVWLIAKFFYTRFKKVEKECAKIGSLEKEITDGLELSKVIEHKIDTQTENYSDLSDKLHKLNDNINSLVTFLTIKHTDLQSGLFKSFSPIQLTDIGIEVLDKSGGKDYIENHISTLLPEMEKENFKSALDVQNFATSKIIKAFNQDDFVHIRNYIFQNPIYRTHGDKEISIDVSTIQQVMGIFLRDKYFEKHPELKDVDS